MRVEATVSPRLEKKIVYAGANSASFTQAGRDLENLADVEISAERIRRATLRHGEIRCEVKEHLEKAYLHKTIPQQSSKKPADAQEPPIAVVMCDGGKYQRLDRGSTEPKPDSYWKESRVACLLSMKGADYGPNSDELPDFLKDVSIAKTLAEIGYVQGENALSETTFDKDVDPPWKPCEMLGKEVVASSCNWKDFGVKVASAAWYRGFAAAREKVFVSDGSVAIESLAQRWFSEYVSVLDLMHALSYSLAASRAIEPDTAKAWELYVTFASLIWQGKVDEVLMLLEHHQKALGEPPPDATASDRREIVRVARVYYRNHQDRMNYPLYRRRGYPLTSSIMESTVKQVSRRVKGSEKFWSGTGAQAILQLRGDYLSDSEPMAQHWRDVIAHADGHRTYTLSA